MPICESCNKTFPMTIKIDGKKRNLCSRRYCLECSPFGKHNTKKFKDGVSDLYTCSCGERDPSKFYGHRKDKCRACFNKEAGIRQKDIRKKAREYFGCKCYICGDARYEKTLEIHHLDPALKDPNFGSMNSWSWERVEEELKNCVLLCKTCHSAYHKKYFSIIIGW